MIERLRLPANDGDVRDLAQILVDAVDSGAAASFLATLTQAAAEEWWRATLDSAPPGTVVLVAREGAGEPAGAAVSGIAASSGAGVIVGTVTMHPAWAPNQPHRADIAKLLVHRRARRQGLGTLLMQRIEEEARRGGFTLLTLDTKRGDPADGLYRRLGWTVVGTIPRFAVDTDGVTPHDAVLFYKDLEAAFPRPETDAASPWLRIPIGDYEAHMDRIGQSEALREVFARALMETRPRRVLVLGCSGGGDFPLVDPEVTSLCVGVDLNPAAIEEARRRGAERCCADVRLIAGDALDVALPDGGFDLVHAALVLEYVDAARLFERIARWLDPDGACVTVTQTPVAGVAAVSCTGHDSLHLLSSVMTLRTPDELESIAQRAGLQRTGARDLSLPGGKRFAVGEFRKAAGERRVARDPR